MKLFFEKSYYGKPTAADAAMPVHVVVQDSIWRCQHPHTNA